MAAQTTWWGEGKIFIGPRAGGILRWVGQVKKLALGFEEETKKLQNYTGGGGLAEQVSRVSEVTLDLEFASLSVQNLAMVLRGEDSPLAAGTVSNEAHTAYAGGLILLDGIGPSEVTVTVDPPAWSATAARVVGNLVKPGTGTHFYRCTAAGTTGATEPTWPTDGTTVVDGTATWQDLGTMALASGEFQVEPAGISFPEGSAKIAVTGTPVRVGYSQAAGFDIQMLVNPAQEYRLVYSGKNAARGGTPIKAEFYRVVFGTLKSIELLGSDFANLPITAVALQDDTRQGSGISQFCKIEVVEV